MTKGRKSAKRLALRIKAWNEMVGSHIRPNVKIVNGQAYTKPGSNNK